MKKILTSILVMLSVVSFASPTNLTKAEIVKKVDWTQPFTKSFDEPYVVLYQGFGPFRDIPTNTWVLRLYVEMGSAVPYPYRVTLKVPGVWFYDGPGDKYFDVNLSTGQSYKYQDYLVHRHDDIATALIDWADQGPI